MNLTEEVKSAKQKEIKISCCKSYCSPKGRCLDCVENYSEDDQNYEIDQFEY